MPLSVAQSYYYCIIWKQLFACLSTPTFVLIHKGEFRNLDSSVLKNNKKFVLKPKLTFFKMNHKQMNNKKHHSRSWTTLVSMYV